MHGLPIVFEADVKNVTGTTSVAANTLVSRLGSRVRTNGSVSRRSGATGRLRDH